MLLCDWLCGSEVVLKPEVARASLLQLARRENAIITLYTFADVEGYGGRSPQVNVVSSVALTRG